MNAQRTTFFVDGMTCPSCEARIRKAVSGLSGVTSVDVSLQKGTAAVSFDASVIGIEEIKASIVNIGYTVRERRGSGGLLALGLGLVLVAVYLLAGSLGLFSFLPRVNASVGYAMLFVVGILTSIHCVAMCGGIALSQTVGTGRLPSASGSARLASLATGLLYNGGRVLSYTVIGAIAGAAGAAFNFSPAVKGLITLIAGLLMIILSLRALGLLGFLPRLSGFLPVGAGKAFSSVAAFLRRGGPFGVGVLNGFMPCGPLQTMQLYALGTGSALAGAASMFVFSLGTVPLMLLFAVTATLLPRKFVPAMVRALSVFVLFLGFLTITRAAALAGLSMPSVQPGDVTLASLPTSTVAQSRPKGLSATVSGGKQTIVTAFSGGQYVPFTVQSGIPLEWTIRVTEEDLNGCNNPLVVPSLGIKKELVAGDNLITFTPSKSGRIPYSCWMGMVRSSITVVDDLSDSSDLQGTAPSSASGNLRGRGGCCSGGGLGSRMWSPGGTL